MGLPKDSPFYPIPAERIILETANCLAFYDAYPVSRGHALIVPHRPVLSLCDLDEQMQAEIWDTVRRVREILRERFNPAGFNIGVNDGRAAGQTVPHAHVHVIPRYAGDVADPTGGIRTVIPKKARYWKDSSGESVIEVVGIDVGVAKGLHVVGLRSVGADAGGEFTVLGNGVSIEDTCRTCLERKPSCVAIDSPSAWAAGGKKRKGERDLQKLGIQLFSTPSAPRKQRSVFYGWMRVGFQVFNALRSEYPLYREGQVGRHALEVFPHATAVALAGRHRPDGIKKAAWRKRVLADMGFDVTGLPNVDCVDAALAALTAAHALRGSFMAFGDPAEGVIVTPYADAAERFRTARSAAGRRNAESGSAERVRPS